MRKPKNSVLSVILLSLALIPAGAQQRADPWWYILEQGKKSFREGSYGDALLIFDDARRQRRAMYERMERDLIDLMSVSEVRRMADSLDLTEAFARQRRYDSAVEALDEVYYRFPRESFRNSANAALQALGSLKDYPEAEYWIGETYRAEGELGLAISQFQKAYEKRALLQAPGFDVELLYKIALIRKTKQEYTEMERTLLSILAGDSLWSAVEENGKVTENSFARNAMTRTLENDGIGRFLTLYRYANTQAEEAHRQLGLYYYASGRHSRAAEHLMFAFLIQNSIIIQEIIRHEYDFTFTGLEELVPQINRYTPIAEYAENVDYYKTAYYLACGLYGNGKTSPARGLWSFLASYAPPGEWRNRARGQLREPRVERIVEMP
jgi:tetratricopeptide (TPR) repeat protein